jgi:5-methylcytosine-specific restriction endonuclease McrA
MVKFARMNQVTRADAIASGLKRYFTGEPCRHGHVAERRVSDHGCVECSRLKARSEEYREKRRDYFAAHQRNYRKLQPERVKATEQRRNKDERAAVRRADRKARPERHRAALSRSYQKHKAQRMADTRAWKKANPAAWSALQRAAKARRRALEYGAEGSYTRQDIERMLAEQKFICAACPADLTECFHIDHKLPLSRGGSNWPINLHLLCPSCNQSKGNKTMEEWAAWKAAMDQTSPPGKAGASTGAPATFTTLGARFESRMRSTSPSEVILSPRL